MPTDSETIGHVSVEAPPFWSENPTLWFSQIESQFILAKVTTDDTKYAHVVSSLTEKMATEVQDILSTPPSTDKYETLKAALIYRMSQSQTKRLQQLLHSEELGDCTPSQLLRRLKTLANTAISEDVLKNIWISRLPSDVQRILTVSEGGLESLAKIADQLHELYTSASQQISSITRSNTDELHKQIAELTKQVSELSTRNRIRSRNRYYKRSRSRSRSNADSGDICWYHRRFGAKANHCRQPCSYQSGNEVVSQ